MPKARITSRFANVIEPQSRKVHQIVSANSRAFTKLRDLLMLHFAVRAKSAEKLGQPQTAAIETYVAGRLANSFPELAADWPPA